MDDACRVAGRDARPGAADVARERGRNACTDVGRGLGGRSGEAPEGPLRWFALVEDPWSRQLREKVPNGRVTASPRDTKRRPRPMSHPGLRAGDGVEII